MFQRQEARFPSRTPLLRRRAGSGSVPFWERPDRGGVEKNGRVPGATQDPGRFRRRLGKLVEEQGTAREASARERALPRLYDEAVKPVGPEKTGVASRALVPLPPDPYAIQALRPFAHTEGSRTPAPHGFN